MNPLEDLQREIKEEMNLAVNYVAEYPAYFITGTKSAKGYWNVNIVYETELESLDFTPTDECVAVKFIGKEDVAWLDKVEQCGNISKLLTMFNPQNHTT